MKLRRIVTPLSWNLFLLILLLPSFSCTQTTKAGGVPVAVLSGSALANRNVERAMALVDTAMNRYFVGEEMAMARFYNPITQERSAERGSVWMYTSAIESVNALLHALKSGRQQGYEALYDAHFQRYVDLLAGLYANADYYLGSFQLTSFTQTKTWSVYAVDRVNEKGKANVGGILNVYDDQMWLIRELLDSYRLTGQEAYLAKAEYLTEYVLDGWDTTLDEQGKEHGGIPWGPGYVTKHACSNGPLISSLVWLTEIYAFRKDEIDYRFIDPKDKHRKSIRRLKEVHYLDYAQKVYDWQKKHLLNDQGVYADMMGGCGPNCQLRYEHVDGQKYRKNTPVPEAQGEAYSYNSGSMLSGAADLYRVSQDSMYLSDGNELSEHSFRAFADLGKELPGYYSYQVGGFRTWFNGILLRGYLDMHLFNPKVAAYINSFQQNLDHGYAQFNRQGFLPVNLLKGWEKENQGKGVEGMFQFTFAAEYASLARFEYEK